MIDCEEEVYTKVKEAVTLQYPDVSFSSTYIAKLVNVPHISVYVFNNTPYSRSRTLSTRREEEHSVTSLEVRYHVKNVSGGKQEMKEYMRIVDETLVGMNFNRILYPFTQVTDTGLLEGIARYEVIVDNNHFYKR